MMIKALPAWQSHFSIASIGKLYVARPEPVARRLQLCGRLDPHGATGPHHECPQPRNSVRHSRTTLLFDSSVHSR
jgi:hypothetical protein